MSSKKNESDRNNTKKKDITLKPTKHVIFKPKNLRTSNAVVKFLDAKRIEKIRMDNRILRHENNKIKLQEKKTKATQRELHKKISSLYNNTVLMKKEKKKSVPSPQPSPLPSIKKEYRKKNTYQEEKENVKQPEEEEEKITISQSPFILLRSSNITIVSHNPLCVTIKIGKH